MAEDNERILTLVTAMKDYSYIDINAHSCMKPFSIGPKAMFKQQNPCSNHQIHVPFEHGFWTRSVDVIVQCDMTSLCSVKWLTFKKVFCELLLC